MQSKAESGKRITGDCCASSHPTSQAMYGGLLPSVRVRVGECDVSALVDTGCTKSLVHVGIAGECYGQSNLIAFDGTNVRCLGLSKVMLVVNNQTIVTEMMVVESIVCDFKIVLGMDVIKQLGGVTVGGGGVAFGGVCASVCDETKCPDYIEDKDFTAKFNGEYWEVSWKWISEHPPILKNRVASYSDKLEGSKRVAYETELDRWVSEGILVEWNRDDVNEGLLALMAVEQPTKNKIRPVLDYRELNQHVSCHTGDEVTDVCGEKLREWRRIDGMGEIVDLKCAYMQIRVAPELWKHQLVCYKGKTYCLTRLGFGLNSAPRIMSKILKTVLSSSREIGGATDSYIDDILVDTSKTDSNRVIKHLGSHGLVAKPPESLANGSALGLKLETNGEGALEFRRGNELPEVEERMTRRQLFSLCGRLVGHYPVAGWLRVSCSYVKRRAEGVRWDDYIGDRALSMIKEVMQAVKVEDPVRGMWRVIKTDIGRVWCDASDLAMGVVVEIDGTVVEDASWLRKKDDYGHINVAELEAVLRGVNLAVKWGLSNIEIVTDSVTVSRWVNLTITEEKRVKTKGAAEVIVKRRLGVLRDLVDELCLKVTIVSVPSSENKADILTRVRKKWLLMKGEGDACAAVLDVRKSHEAHHMVIEKTLYLARKIDPTVQRGRVKAVVSSCERCQRIDPAPVCHVKGELSVENNWERLAMDVTHYRNRGFLSIIDCGPGRFAIWREVKKETSEVVISNLEQIFYERGPPKEILMDNATAFRSAKMREFLASWGVDPCYRAAYRASGNGIIERHHRTIKAKAERGEMDPIQAVYWYNVSPRSGQEEETIPQRAVHPYEWRLLLDYESDDCGNEVESCEVKIGDEVWVKPPNVRCTSQWTCGKVTGCNSGNNVEVDGMPRHILDIRQVVRADEAQDTELDIGGGDHAGGGGGVPQGDRRYPARLRRPPGYLADYVTT